MTTERNSQSEAIIHRAGVERSRGIGGVTEYPLCSRNARPQKEGRERPGALLARRTRTIKRMERTPTLILCSRNARPEKGLVRRAHVDQHGCPSQRGKASELGRIIKKDGGRSMRAVKGGLGYSLQRRHEKSAIPLGGRNTMATPSILSTPTKRERERAADGAHGHQPYLDNRYQSRALLCGFKN